MSRLPILSSKQVIKVLRTVGFEDAPKRGKEGSHLAFVKRDAAGTKLVIIPESKSLPRGTPRAILDQAGLSREEFLRLVSRS